MIVKVYLTAFSHNGDFRMVEVPEVVMNVPEPKDAATMLEEVFFWGQNDHQEVEGKPSVSMGDVAELDGKYWLCCSTCWKELSFNEWLDYLGLSILERSRYCMRLWSLRALSAQAQELDMGY